MQDLLSSNKAEQLKAIKISQHKLRKIDLDEYTNTNKNNLNSIYETQDLLSFNNAVCMSKHKR